MDQPAIRTITKKELCILFGLVSPSGRTIYYKKLVTDYFTDEVLQRLGLERADYADLRGGKPFSFEQTRAIIRAFDIREEELSALYGRKAA